MNMTRRNMMLTGTALIASGCTAQDSSTKPLQNNSEWEASTALPLAVQEIYPTGHKNRIHQAGGFIATDGRISGPTNKHFSWAPDEADWREESSLPIARHHPQMISFKGQLLALAGFESKAQDAAWIMQKSGWALSENGQWESAPDLPSPCGEAVLGMTGDGLLHIAGGRTPLGANNAGWQDHGDTDHHFVLDRLGGIWQRAAPCLSKRNSASGDIIDGALHIVGGRQVGGGNVATHEVYDHKEDRWREAAPMPQAQGGLAAASLGGKLYAFGGEYFDNGGGVYPESWIYSPENDRWDALPDMLTPRHGLGAVSLNNAIYVIGGAKQASGVDTSAIVERYIP
jgi:hypothetical protein